MILLHNSCSQLMRNFIEGGHKIACQKGVPVKISDYIPTSNSSLEQCYKCDCPDHFVRCSSYNQTSKCRTQSTNDDKVLEMTTNREIKTTHIANKTNAELKINFKNLSLADRLIKSTNQSKARSASPITNASKRNADDLLKVGATTYHLSGKPELNLTQNASSHLTLAAEALGLNPDEFTRKREGLLRRIKSMTNQSSITMTINSNGSDAQIGLSVYETDYFNNNQVLLPCGEPRLQACQVSRFLGSSDSVIIGPLTRDPKLFTPLITEIKQSRRPFAVKKLSLHIRE